MTLYVNGNLEFYLARQTYLDNPFRYQIVFFIMQKCVILFNIYWGEQTVQNKTDSLTKDRDSDHMYQYQKDSKI